MSADRFFDTIARIVRQAFPWIGYSGTYEYAVFASNSDGTYDLKEVDPTAGLPPLPSVVFKPGIPGLTSALAVGSLVYVAFINHNAARAFIVAVAAPGDAGFTPTSLSVDASGAIGIGHASSTVNAGGGYAPGIRVGEGINIVGLVCGGTPVTATPGATFITLDPSVLTPGAPPHGYSTVNL